MNKLIIKWLAFNKEKRLINPPRKKMFILLTEFYGVLFLLVTFSYPIVMLAGLAPVYFAWILYYTFYIQLWKMCGYSVSVLNAMTIFLFFIFIPIGNLTRSSLTSIFIK